MKNAYQVQEDAAIEALNVALEAVRRAQFLVDEAGWGSASDNGWVCKPLEQARGLIDQALDRASGY